jgi:glycosyltransferase involved in cell wall biosynthesis
MLSAKLKNKSNCQRINIIVREAWSDKKNKWGLWKESINDSIEYFTYGVNNKFPYLSSLWAGIRALMNKSELTIIHTPGAAIPFCLLNNFLPKKKKCIILEMILDTKWKKMWPLFGWVFKNVDRFVVFSRDEVDYYSKKFCLDKRKLTWLALGVRLPAVNKDKRSGLNGYAFAGGKTRRDYALFVRAANSARIRALIICGEKYFKTLKEERGEKIEIYPRVDYETFWRMLTEAKYVVVPLAEKYISCGQLVFLGAMARGKAVVVPRVAATADYIRDGITGFFYEYGEYRSLTSVLERLEREPELVGRVGIEGKKEVIKHNNAKDFVKRLEELMFTVLSENHQS